MPNINRCQLRSRKKERGKLARNVSKEDLHNLGSSFDLSMLSPEVDEVVDEFMGQLKMGKKTNKFYKGTKALLDDLRKGRNLAIGRNFSRTILRHLKRIGGFAKGLRNGAILSNNIRLGKLVDHLLLWPLLYYEVHTKKSLRPAVHDLATLGVSSLIKKYLVPNLFSVLTKAAFPKFLALTLTSMIVSEILDSMLPEDFLSWSNAMNVEYVQNKVIEEDPKKYGIRYEKWSDSRFTDYEITGFSGAETFSGGFQFRLSLKYQKNRMHNRPAGFRDLDIHSLVGQSISWGVQGARLNFLGITEYGGHAGRFEMEHTNHKYHHSVPAMRWFHGRIQAVHINESGKMRYLWSNQRYLL